jgi:hypothetical protein
MIGKDTSQNEQMLHEMISQTLNEVSDPKFQQGFKDGEAAGIAQIKNDPGKEIKNADPIHWETIDTEAPEHGSYREGFIMGYGSIWMGMHGTNVSLAMPPAAANAADFKDSPSATRKFNKWEL